MKSGSGLDPPNGKAIENKEAGSLFLINGNALQEAAERANAAQNDEARKRCKKLFEFLKANYNPRLKRLPRNAAKFNEISLSGAANFTDKTLRFCLEYMLNINNYNISFSTMD
jgi:hypothetical protein